MNDKGTFSFKQHVSFLIASTLIGGAGFLLDMNYDNLPHYAKKSEQPQLIAQHNAEQFSHVSQPIQ